MARGRIAIVARVKIKFEELPKVLRALGPAAAIASKRAALETAKYSINAIKRTIHSTVPQPIATKEYLEGWKVRETPTSAVVENHTPQAYYIEKGRSPGPAPLEPFRLWARAKLRAGGLGGMTADRLAFLAHRKVVKKGYKARKIVERTMPRIKAQLAKQLRKEMRSVSGKAVRMSKGGYVRTMFNSGY